MGLPLVSKRLEHIDSGYVPAFEVWVAHLNQVDAWTVGIHSSFVAGLWRVDGTWIVEFTSLNLKGSSSVPSPYLI